MQNIPHVQVFYMSDPIFFSLCLVLDFMFCFVSILDQQTQ